MATSEDNFDANDFEVVKELGSGRFGKVYLIKHYTTGELLARKEIKLSHLPDNEDARARTMLEVDVMKQINHKHIMAFRYHFITIDYLHIYTEYCSGEDLKKLIVKLSKFALPEKLIVCWLSQMVDALKYLHDKRILHRDLKPDNIYLAENADIKLGDFGIARTLKSTEFKIETMIGTPVYMSPEILSSQGYNQKTDVWSLGCVIYELATTNRAFNGISYAHIVFQVVLGNPPFIPDIYSNDLVSLNSRMMIKTPEERPSADEIMEYEPVRSYLRKPYKPSSLFKAIISFSDITSPLKNLSQSLSDEHPKQDLKKIVKTSSDDYTKDVDFERKPKNDNNRETTYESAEIIVNEHTKHNVKQTIITSDDNYIKMVENKNSDDDEDYINFSDVRVKQNNTRFGAESGYERDGSARRLRRSSLQGRVSDDDYEETHGDLTNNYPRLLPLPLKYREHGGIYYQYEGPYGEYKGTFDEYGDISDKILTTMSTSSIDSNYYDVNTPILLAQLSVQDQNLPTLTKDERRNFLSKQIHDLKGLCVRGLGNETFETAYGLVKQKPHSSNLEQKLKEVLKDKNDKYHGHIVYIALFETLISEIK